MRPSAAHLGEFAVCVKPFHYGYNRAVWLVEFIEFHRPLGVSQFVFYNHTVGPDVERVLRFYSARGLVTVLPWHIQLRWERERTPPQLVGTGELRVFDVADMRCTICPSVLV